MQPTTHSSRFLSEGFVTRAYKAVDPLLNKHANRAVVLGAGLMGVAVCAVDVTFGVADRFLHFTLNPFSLDKASTIPLHVGVALGSGAVCWMAEKKGTAIEKKVNDLITSYVTHWYRRRNPDKEHFVMSEDGIASSAPMSREVTSALNDINTHLQRRETCSNAAGGAAVTTAFLVCDKMVGNGWPAMLTLGLGVAVTVLFLGLSSHEKQTINEGLFGKTRRPSMASRLLGFKTSPTPRA